MTALLQKSEPRPLKVNDRIVHPLLGECVVTHVGHWIWDDPLGPQWVGNDPVVVKPVRGGDVVRLVGNSVYPLINQEQAAAPVAPSIIRELREEYQHRAEVTDDGSEECIFRWHWPRNTFDSRMSALEIAAFIIPHMPAILPFLAYNPRIYAEWKALLQRLVLWPNTVLDEVVPWVRRIEHCEMDEILILDLRAKDKGPAPAVFSLPGVK